MTLALSSSAGAGSSETGKTVLSAADVAAFSNRVQQDLAARGVRVAIVARMGRDPRQLSDGVRHTHVGFWVYSQIVLADGSKGNGYRVYNLYQDGENKTQSSLVQDSPTDFFAGAHRLDAGIIMPEIRLQKKLLKVIASLTYSALDNPNYSVLSNANTRQLQNCTEHTLDVVMAGLYGTSNPAQIKANVAEHFEPQVIRIGGLKRLLAPAASQALTTQDHGDKVMTATFSSISRFMQSHKLAVQAYRLTPDKAFHL